MLFSELKDDNSLEQSQICMKLQICEIRKSINTRNKTHLFFFLTLAEKALIFNLNPCIADKDICRRARVSWGSGGGNQEELKMPFGLIYYNRHFD